MFEHSVRVPRHYKIAANIFKKVSTEGGSVKTLLYDDKLRHFRTNVLYALITETIKHAANLDKLFESCSLFEKESRLDPWLAKVLATELLFGKKALPGQSKPEQTILTYKDKFETFLNENSSDLKTKVVRRPRYVRINTNLLTTSDAIRAFQDEGYHFIRCTSGPYDDYLKQIQGLSEYDFTQDYHVKTVFVFAAGTKFHEHELYLENKIILQDKATAMAVHLLAPEPGSVVLDMCAAPGMKTTQLAAYMRNEGKIYAVERNEKRYETLCDFVERTGSKCVQTMLKDALEIRLGDCDDVQYILLDPSCSGSGMELCVHNYIEESRLAKLTSLQEKFLKHAMNAFPRAKKIVYSTCSLFPEENERVITNVVKTSRAKWRVLDVNELLKGQWNNFGSGMYGSMGARCMYAKPETDLTTGFFLAVLERDPIDLEKSLSKETADGESEMNNKDDTETKNVGDEFVAIEKKSRKKRKHQSENVTETEPESEVTHKKKKKNKDQFIDKTDNNDKDFEESVSEMVKSNSAEISHKKKKNKKDKNIEKRDKNYNNEQSVSALTEPNSALDTENVPEEERGQRKKKKKRNKDEQNSINESNDIGCNNSLNLEDIQTSQPNEKSKKKKKKRDSTEFKNEEDSANNVEKAVKNNIKNDDAINDAEFSEPNKKKSSKTKKTPNENQLETETATTLNSEVNFEVPTKKKKKKSKQSLGSRIRAETKQWDT